MGMVMAISIIFTALKKVFSQKSYIIISVLAAFAMFTILILLPVGRFNTKAFYYQITGLDSISLFVIGFFSFILGILISMNIYLIKKTHESKKKLLGSWTGMLSIFSSFIAGMFGSAVCVACLSILFNFLGVGTITFLITYRTQFFVLSAIIAVFSLYSASKGVIAHEECKVCKVHI